MKVSIIVPVYNSEKYIDKLVNSVLNQTYQNYELILVNDGSTDNSLKKLKKIQKKDSRIKVFDKKNSGPGLTRKYGFEKCNGDLIYFVDSDDWITHDTDLEEIVNEFNQNKIDILFFDREDIIEKKSIDIIKGFDNISPGIHKVSNIDDIVRPGLGNKILKKELLKSEMFIESSIFEDLYTTYLYLDKCTCFEYKDKVFYSIYHNDNEKSLSSITTSDKVNMSLEILIDLYNNVNTLSLKKSILYRSSLVYFSYMVRKIKHKECYTSEKFNKLINELGKILKDNNITFYGKSKLKKIIYKVFLIFFAKGDKNEGIC